MSEVSLEEDYSSILKSKKIVLTYILVLIYSSFLGLQLGKIQAIADYNYNLHEMLYIPANLAIFTLPVMLIIYLFLVFKSRKYAKKRITLRGTLKKVIIIISLVFIFGITGYETQNVSTTGVYEINEKVQEGNYYFILLADKKIRVSRNEFHLIKVQEDYLVVYQWNKNSPQKGKLEVIEPIIK